MIKVSLKTTSLGEKILLIDTDLTVYFFTEPHGNQVDLASLSCACSPKNLAMSVVLVVKAEDVWCWFS